MNGYKKVLLTYMFPVGNCLRQEKLGFSSNLVDRRMRGWLRLRRIEHIVL